MALSRIHINGHVLRANRKHGRRDPVITIKTGRANVYAMEAHGPGFRVVYRPDAPLKCGAVVWVETDEAVTPIGVPA